MACASFRLGRDCLCRREAPEIGHFTFPLCWRCSGMMAGVAGLLAVGALGGLPAASACVAIAGCICGLPAAVDVCFQVMTPYRSNRSRRFVTGVHLGNSIVLLAHVLVQCLRGFL
jgi:uncharacterized membrane protein